MPKSKNTYLDYASSALSVSANPGAIHALGMIEKKKLEEARGSVARVLGVGSDEIIFTSGATESNNLAILGVVQSFKYPHIITTNIEHASVLEVYKFLQKTKRVRVTFVKVEASGEVDPKKIQKALRSDTVLVSVMYANNEIGTIEPIREIAKEIRHFNKINAKKVLFHTDATQAVNYLPIQVPKLGVDLLSFNSAKIYGPKGVGVLFKKRGITIIPVMHGGNQEQGLRPGTENVVGAVALARALDETEKMKEKEVKRITKFRDYFVEELRHSDILKNVGMILNGDLGNRLPNNVNITIPGIPSDLLVIELSTKGIYASSKSACKQGDDKASHVIQAINPKLKDTDGSIRFSLGRETKKKDIDRTILALSEILKKLKKWYN